MSDFPSPLPLAAFEEYMLRDDRPNVSDENRRAAAVHRPIGPQAGSAALEQVIARHPLLRAKIRKTAAGRLEWIAAKIIFLQFNGSTARDTIACPPCGRSIFFPNPV